MIRNNVPYGMAHAIYIIVRTKQTPNEKENKPMMNRNSLIDTILDRHERNMYPSHETMIHDLMFLGNMGYTEAVRTAKEVNRKYEARLNRRSLRIAR